MKKVFVLDCSVAISWFIEDEANESSDACLSMLAFAEAIVPAIWPFEFTNALLIAERKKRITSEDASKIMFQSRQLPIKVEDVPSLQCFEAFTVLGQEYGLTIYDAAYLEAALRLDIPLASRDVDLSRAARQIGIELLT